MILNIKHRNILLFCFTILFLPIISYAFNIKNTPSKNAYFVGRDLYLKKIQEKLLSKNLLYLTGYGGIGKSQLANEYSHINRQKYDLIWWFDLKSELGAQYENLLTHISNSKRFKGVLNINVNNIAPSALIDFTNTLLSECNCKWLLIFDNALSTDSIKLPKTKTTWQHIIVTTREKPVFGNSYLTLGPFTNEESEVFLFKIHPQEKKEEIVKLYTGLHNYPLALAQVSEEILTQGNGIGTYLKKHNNFSIKSVPIYSYITQNYNNNYYEVLDNTLQEIEQKDREAAKVLYILALVNVNFTEDFQKKLFGSETKEKIIILNKHGLIQTNNFGETKVLVIHDIIRDIAIKRLNTKDATYKKDIIHSLISYFSNFYLTKDFKYLNSLSPNDNHVTVLYAFIDIALKNNIINEEVITAIILSLKLNNILFNRHADYVLYQQLANKIYNKNMDNVLANKKALLYANLIFSDFIFESKEKLSKFEQEMLRLSKLTGNNKNCEELFFVYTQMSQFYLFLGNLNEAKKYAKHAEKIINCANENYGLLQYWYTNTWLSYELRDIDAGMEAIDNYIKVNDQLASGKLGKLFLRNLKIKFMILLGLKKEAEKKLEKMVIDAKTYYNNKSSDISGELEFTKALIYFQEEKYSLAKNQCHRALVMLTEVFGGDIIDLTQAHIHILLGKIYEEEGKYNASIEQYKKVMEYYNKISYGKDIDLHEYGELLANLSVVYYKINNFTQAKFYYRKLVAVFGLEHDITEKLMKNLPQKYIYQIGGYDEK